MASFSIPFHAIPEELATFVEEWMLEYGITAIAVEYHPFAASCVERSDVRAALMRSEVRRLLFTEHAPDCVATGNNELLDKNNDALVLDIGRLSPQGMAESCLSTRNATATWRGIAGHLRRNTKAGVIGTNERTGASARYRDHRHTAGARALAEKGTPLRPFPQSPVVLQPDAS